MCCASVSRVPLLATVPQTLLAAQAVPKTALAVPKTALVVPKTAAPLSLRRSN